MYLRDLEGRSETRKLKSESRFIKPGPIPSEKRSSTSRQHHILGPACRQHACFRGKLRGIPKNAGRDGRGGPALATRCLLRHVLKNRPALLWIDNEPARVSLSKGTADPPALRALSRVMQAIEVSHPSVLCYERVCSHSNPADMPSKRRERLKPRGGSSFPCHGCCCITVIFRHA